MIARFIASLLSLCMALPLCWCCAAVEQPDPGTRCCAMAQHEPCGQQAPQEDQTPRCPCLMHEDSRETAVTTVDMPAPELRLLAALIWRQADSPPLAARNRPAPGTPRHDDGPPGIAPPLYQRHCALLI